MRRKLYPLNVLTRARRIMVAWELIGQTVILGSLSRKAFCVEMMQVEAIEERIRTAEIQLTNLRNERDAAYLSLWDKVKRVYEGIRASYGDDSSEYEMVGRIRASQIKRRSRKTAME